MGYASPMATEVLTAPGTSGPCSGALDTACTRVFIVRILVGINETWVKAHPARATHTHMLDTRPRRYIPLYASGAVVLPSSFLPRA